MTITKLSKKIVVWLLSALACLAFLLGIAVGNPAIKTASAATVTTEWASFNFEPNVDNTTNTRLRFNTTALAWQSSANGVSDDKYLVNTLINGKTVKELNEAELASGGTAQIQAFIQPAGKFSFYSVVIPASFTQITRADISSVALTADWTFTDPATSTVYTTVPVRYDSIGELWYRDVNFVNLDSGNMIFVDQGLSHAGVNCFFIGFGQQVFSNYFCMNDNYQKTSAITGMRYGQNLDNLLINGKTIGQIKSENPNYDYASSEHGHIKNGGVYAPIFAHMSTGDVGRGRGNENFIQFFVPTDLLNPASVTEVTLKPALFNYVQDTNTKYGLTEEITFVKKDGVWVNEKDLLTNDNTTVSTIVADGEAGELYRVDITSSLWDSVCDPYDYNYGGFVSIRQNLLINGVSVHTINTTVDDSQYAYKTSPMTSDATFTYEGKTYDLFANPVLLKGKGDTLSLFIFKDYLDAIDGVVTLTIGEGFTYCNKKMDKAISAVIRGGSINSYVVTIDGAEQIVEEGGYAKAPATPTKAEDATYTYSFDNWYIVGTDTVFLFSTPITQNVNVEARFTAHKKDTTTKVSFIARLDKEPGLDKETGVFYGYSVRFDTVGGVEWGSEPGWLETADWTSIADYTFINGKSVTEINAGIEEGQKLTFVIQAAETFSFLRVFIPETVMPVDDVLTMSIVSGWSYDNGTTNYVADTTQIFYNNSGTMTPLVDEVLPSDVTISNMIDGGEANELYVIQISSNKWSIPASVNAYDYNYFGACYLHIRKNIFINGVSLYEINTTVDDKAYEYSTYPMTISGAEPTGTGYDLFQNPTLLHGSGNTLTIWVHKDYISSLGAGDITVTIGHGVTIYAEGGAVLLNECSKVVGGNYMVTFTDYDGTVFDTQIVARGGFATKLADPIRPTTATAQYTFLGWKDSNGKDFSFTTPITSDMTIVATYAEHKMSIRGTTVLSIQFLYADDMDNWLVFTLSDHDYTCPTNSTSKVFTKDELLRVGLLDSIVLKGTLGVGEETRQEATLAEILTANGEGEGGLVNYWGEGKLGFRVRKTPNYNAIDEIIVRANANFPSYQYGIEKTTDVDIRYATIAEQSFHPGTANNDSGSTWVTPYGSSSISGYDIFMEDGAAIRLVQLDHYDGEEDYMATQGYKQSGIRFQTNISLSTIEKLQSYVGGVYQSVSFGTLIVPTADIAGGLFTHQWLEANNVTYMDIPSSAWITATDYEFAKDTGDVVSFFGSIVNIKESNHTRNFSGIGYIRIEKDGETLYFYAPVNKSCNRSISYIAQAAVSDRSKTENEHYDNKIDENGNWSPYTNGEITFLKLYMGTLAKTEVDAQSFTLTSTGALASVANARNTGTLTVNKALKGAYVQLSYNTNIDVWGQFHYQNAAGTKTAVEDFYLQKGTSQHKQFLDLYRKNGVGKLAGLTVDDLYLTKITFQNATVDKYSSGSFNFLGLYSSARDLGTPLSSGGFGQEIYVTKTLSGGGEMTVGAHLGLGGSLTYLAKSGIYEGVTSSSYQKGDVRIQSNTTGLANEHATSILGWPKEDGYYGSATSSKPGDGAVNLINNYDAGRQIQQSWYANVGGSLAGNTGANGYTRLDCDTGDGGYWPYNPVQAGDCNSNPGQIIDYEINETEGYLYIKSRAMDWAYGDTKKGGYTNGSTTKSYTENYYRLKEDGTLFVNNSFVDWNGFTDMANCDFCLVELPAFYPVHTLNNFFTYDGTSPWTNGALTHHNNLSGWTGGGNSHRQSNIDPTADGTLGEEWVAWANDANGSIALGMYIPNVTALTSGRSHASVSLSLDTGANSNAKNNLLKSKGLMSNMQPVQYTYQSCYVQNTSYTAPGISFRMEAYKPIEYTYVLSVNDITTMRSQFKAIHDSGKVTNAGSKAGEKVGLDAWARSDKIWTQF